MMCLDLQIWNLFLLSWISRLLLAHLNHKSGSMACVIALRVSWKWAMVKGNGSQWASLKIDGFTLPFWVHFYHNLGPSPYDGLSLNRATSMVSIVYIDKWNDYLLLIWGGSIPLIWVFSSIHGHQVLFFFGVKWPMKKMPILYVMLSLRCGGGHV